MGREVKRVALDFDWPLRKVWVGFCNPHWKQCPDCDGSGATTASQRLGEIVNLILLSGADAANKSCHPYFNEIWALHQTMGKVPSPDMAALSTGLAGRSPMGRMGHDGCDRWTATAKIVKAAGLPKSWGTCKTCKGHGIDPTAKRKYDRWSRHLLL